MSTELSAGSTEGLEGPAFCFLVFLILLGQNRKPPRHSRARGRVGAGDREPGLSGSGGCLQQVEGALGQRPGLSWRPVTRAGTPDTLCLLEPRSRVTFANVQCSTARRLCSEQVAPAS